MTYRYNYEKRISELLKHKNSLINEKKKLFEKKRLFDNKKISSKDFVKLLHNEAFSEKTKKIDIAIIEINSQLRNLKKQRIEQNIKKFIVENRNKATIFSGISIIILLGIFIGLNNPGITGFFVFNETNSTLNETLNQTAIKTNITFIDLNLTNVIKNKINSTTENITTTETNMTNETGLILNETNATNIILNQTSNISTTENTTEINQTIQENQTIFNITTAETNMTNETGLILNETLEEEIYDYSFTLNKILNQNKLILLESEKKQHIDRIIKSYFKNKQNINLIILNSENENFNIQKVNQKTTNLLYIDYNVQPIPTIPFCWKFNVIDSISLISEEGTIGFICSPEIGKLGSIEKNKIYEIASQKDLSNILLPE